VKSRAEKRAEEVRKPVRDVQRWPICDVSGAIVAILVRINHTDGTKTPYWTLPDGTKGLGGKRVEELPLYGAHLLPLYDADTSYTGPLYLCEGPKDTDAMIEKGYPALGTVTGAHTIPSDESLSVLVGRNVKLYPDADPQGLRHMRRIAARLTVLNNRKAR
jgi:hypothetical protein